MTNQTLTTHVFLQTLRLSLRGNKGVRSVRGLVDSGSQRSYILRSTAAALNLKPKRTEKITHCLFGGTQVDNTHYCYDITVFRGNYSITFEVLDQFCICNDVATVFYGPWIQELRIADIDVSDVGESGPIEVLIGADVAGLFYTGRRHKLKSGLVAYETHFGWTMEGKVPTPSSLSMLTTVSMLSNPTITELWQLDVLGISDPEGRKSKEELAMAARRMFEETVQMNEEGRYEVRLPWLEDHPVLPNNLETARKRLAGTLKKLAKDQLISRYDEVFKEWESAGIITKVNADDEKGHYLPHRPVIKEGSTTAVRPVFDASARGKNSPSLNQCLEKGPNLIELIPALLTRFRENKIAVIADIKKAFLQISVNTKDRHFLKFLWVDEKGQEIVYKHNRVVFGVNCSPFLLGATIKYHLSKYFNIASDEGKFFSKENIERLDRSFYVDNCVTSVPDEEVLNHFITQSVQVMQEAGFELRGWEFSGNGASQENGIPVLGLRWYPARDVLTLNRDLINVEIGDMLVTKRKLLSVAQKIFDPIGFTCPATLRPKLWLQELWSRNISWDTAVEDDIAISFKEWVQGIPNLLQIELPRWTNIGETNPEDVSLHTFVDASKDAYATAIFCRIQKVDKVLVYLMAAKSRVAPIEKTSKTLTIPRLELLAATIGSRLYSQVVENLSQRYETYFWSDSTTVIAWIQRNEEWGTFVHNRVEEIRRLTPLENWHHIPGSRNPADLPSRGCSPTHLLESKWWEGPDWLYQQKSGWPMTKQLTTDEGEILREKKKTVKTLLDKDASTADFHLDHFSDYPKTVRMVAWIFRFGNNTNCSKQRRTGDISVQEMNMAEKFIFKLIQKTSYHSPEEIRYLKPFYDEDGLLRLKTSVANRPDTEGFRFPVILPAKHPVVSSLILHTHKKSCHVGVQGLMSLLRENYWVIGGRRAIRSIVKSCVVCKRFSSKHFVVEPPPLPIDRVREAMCFEVTGVDFAGPLYLKTGEKAWVCLFTCAVYRAVHLELASTLSTKGFLQVFRRFVSRRGRPRVIYSDNGTNFRGTDNLFESLDWQKITREAAIRRIEWRFNPPTASWWGGFFERLIGVVKGLLKKVLGSARLNYEELLTIICDCEATVNARPLTYVSSDSEDISALTPAMFLREQVETLLPDCDLIERVCLSRSLRNRQKLRDDLRRRFRTEYLGQLKLLCDQKPNASVKLGQVVLVGNDHSRRVDWPLGRVIEVIRGRDGLIRLARVKTRCGELLRPVRRLYPLECEGEVARDQEGDGATEDHELSSQQDDEPEGQCDSGSAGVSESRAPEIDLNVSRMSRSGRKIKVPQKLLD
ncbi:uncharacterized protein LOC123322673 [Coccinella septempunctata]|uniref:uncharacterized protein LOC123322673 n=1 Tax=Coccinella septempunctata TaxID=41139 RepID=UPI001D06EB57|nr:uncharacterized protein LOC123322673 [Coccinella septempunctata]